MMRTARGVTLPLLLASLLGLPVLSGCGSPPKEDRQRSEQEVHANDSADPSGLKGRHAYRCDDGNMLLVDFKNEGLELELRLSSGDPPSVLSAPAPGLQYQGDTMSAVFKEGRLLVDTGRSPTRTCVRTSAR
jgi:hypothetical protein